jgi:hypothetical protein
MVWGALTRMRLILDGVVLTLPLPELIEVHSIALCLFLALSSTGLWLRSRYGGL